ncbi:MAG: host attachment protein [Planctomycetota bacterium]
MHWLLLVNGSQGKLLQASPTRQGRYRVERRDSIETAWEPHEHGRPSPRGGKDAHRYASRGNEDQEMMQRFARDVTRWLEEQIEHRKIARVAVFAPPRFLGALRQAFSASLARRIDEHEGDLGYMAPADLLHHPTVSALLESDRTA